jgi:hypothetical protein
MPEEVTGAGQGWFAGTGSVGRYWLAHCVGFEVYSEHGSLSGVVAGVELDRDSGDTATLLVHRRHGRPLRLASASVTWVDPWRRVIVVILPSSEPSAASVQAASAAAVRGGQAAVRGGQAAWVGAAKVGAAVAAGAVTARRAAPPSRRFALWLGARAAYALAFAGWLYGATLFVLSRAAVRVLVVAVALLARIGVHVVPPVAHAARTATGKLPTIRGHGARIRRRQPPERRSQQGRRGRGEFHHRPS